MSDIQKGQIVISKAGRDKGKYFLVYDYKKPFVNLVDGKLRRIENPKMKKDIHITVTHYVDEYIFESLENEIRLTNADIRKSLSRFVEDINQEL